MIAAGPACHEAFFALTCLRKNKARRTSVPKLQPEWVSVAFSRLSRKLEIENFHFHDLRHTAASWLRRKGADIHTVAQLLGHKDLRMAARSEGSLFRASKKL